MEEKQPIYTEDNISMDSLIDYVFKKLSVTEEQSMEDFLDSHEEYANTVDGILKYCLTENIKTKIDLEKNIQTSQTAFFARFPELKPENLKQLDDVTPKNKKDNNNLRWGFLAFLMIGGLFILLNVPDQEINKDQSKPEQTEVPKSIETQENKDIETTREDDGSGDQKMKDKKNPINNVSKEKNNTEIPQSIEKQKNKDIEKIREDDGPGDQPMQDKEKSINNTSKEKIKKIPEILNDPKDSAPRADLQLKELNNKLASATPLLAQAEQIWSKEFVVRGESQLNKSSSQLVEGDSTQQALYCLGLYELMKADPNLEIAIKLLQKVKQYEYPDATWFLFRAYVLLGDKDGTQREFRKMTENIDYYNEKFSLDSIFLRNGE